MYLLKTLSHGAAIKPIIIYCEKEITLLLTYLFFWILSKNDNGFSLQGLVNAMSKLSQY
jgi:hypothetical protein